MSSRKQEERNEKVIRGLMKLPPNRKCINCNSLGPQYVCTNFWTFVCMTCSGIHREFTHRVKSVSMSKFTSQEVEALQNGGNQRAREIFLKDWDLQRERPPNNSNAEKVRQFIKDVYVDRKYAVGNNSDKPPKDMQNLRKHEDETRRASSYHSYSQSPPYDYQYEERRYGKQAPALTRKPGSDRGIYERKTFGFLSPSRLSDHVSEDGFANEGSKSRVSDYSVSSGGDRSRSGTHSPSFQRDIGFSSPSSETSRDISNVDVHHQEVNTFADTNAKRDAEQVQHLQRTASVGSGRSLSSNSLSLKSVHSASTVNVASSVSENFGGLDFFNAPFVPQPVTSTAAAIDLFQLPHTLSTSSVDFFQPSPISSVPTLNSHIPSQNFQPSSLSLFSDVPRPQSAATVNEISSDVVSQENEGWATFDRPQSSVPSQAFDNSFPATIPSIDGVSHEKFDQFIPPSASLQQSSFPDFHGSSSSMPNQWHGGLHNADAPLNATSTQPWNAFEDSTGLLFHSIHQQRSEQVAVQNPSSISDQYFGFGVVEDLNKDGTERDTLSSGPIFGMPSHAGAHSHAPDRKSTNPFDLPYDSDMESGNMLLELSSLQAALPNGQISTSFIGAVSQPWFPQDSVAPFVAGGPQGALGFMGAQATSTQIQNVPTQAPVASSIGGNPFA